MSAEEIISNPKITEEGPVSIRRNKAGGNMEYMVTDYHENSYPVSNDRELRFMRAAINTVLKRHGGEISQSGDFKIIDGKEPRRHILTDLNESVLFGFNEEDIPQIIEALEELRD